jgi:hypothetical protein
MGISYPKGIKAKAVEAEKSLFAFSVEDTHLKDGTSKHRIGGLEMIGSMHQDLALSMYKFVIAIRTGKTPRQAFDEAGFPEKTEEELSGDF